MSRDGLDGNIGDLPKLDDLPPLGFTERDLFTIFLKYSESDPKDETATDCQQQASSKDNERPATADAHHSPQEKATEGVGSSPASHHEQDYDSSQMTCSTTHTTPLKHWMMRNEPHRPTPYINFVAGVSDCDLPSNTKDYFISLASQIVQIGGLLQGVQAHRDQEEVDDAILDEAGVLLPLLESSSKNCSDQVANIKWVEELAAFRLIPTDVALWSNYRQRVELVTRSVLTDQLARTKADPSRHLTLPSVTECNILESLVQLHDTYVLSPFLHNATKSFSSNPARPTHPPLIREAISSLTNALHSLALSYKQWLRTLHRFRKTSLDPLLRRIQDSSYVRREIEQSETTLETARENLHKRYRSGEMQRILKEDQLRGAQMLVDRRSKSSVVPAGQLGGGGGGGSGGDRDGNGDRRRGGGVKLVRNKTRVRREHTM